jgi:hypothetical protein
MAWYDYLVGGLLGGPAGLGIAYAKNNPDKLFGDKQPDPKYVAQMPYFEEDRKRLGGMMDGRSPFAGEEWSGLINQLQQ